MIYKKNSPAEANTANLAAATMGEGILAFTSIASLVQAAKMSQELYDYYIEVLKPAMTRTAALKIQAYRQNSGMTWGAVAAAAMPDFKTYGVNATTQVFGMALCDLASAVLGVKL